MNKQIPNHTKKMRVKNKINILNLWVLIGIIWLYPQAILIYTPEHLHCVLKIIPLILLGLSMYTKVWDKILLERKKKK